MKGLSKETIEEISRAEPDWLREFRLRSYHVFMSKSMPKWGADLSGINFQNIYYHARHSEKIGNCLCDVPEYWFKTFLEPWLTSAVEKE
jgi:Fe-S cluster assembly protein SufB